ncbi:MAG: hydrogenase formation protein HypD [bacterium]|nr:hydrogenase formation protein HypD [bacterium]
MNSKNFRNPALIKKIVNNIHQLADKPVNIMEVCGTHTMAIAQYGIRELLPPSIKLISGPGCPVCVTPAEIIDEIIEISLKTDTIIASFGDMIRVPGSRTTLEKMRSEGSDVRIIYSPLELLGLARDNPGKNIVFAGIGFETTSPLAAAVVTRAKKENIKNLFIVPAFKTVPPALRLIADNRSLRLNAFLLPGHVSVIIGSYPYEFLSKEFGLTGVISGFEPVDILYSIYLILKQIKTNRPKIEIQYSRTIKPEGNTKAQKLLDEVFEKSASEWRAIGNIPGSGLIFRKDYNAFSSRSKFNIKINKPKEPKNCLCGKILMGLKTPEECPLFGKQCTPQKAIGPCMVSSEGTCAAYYKYI